MLAHLRTWLRRHRIRRLRAEAERHDRYAERLGSLGHPGMAADARFLAAECRFRADALERPIGALTTVGQGRAG